MQKKSNGSRAQQMVGSSALVHPGSVASRTFIFSTNATGYFTTSSRWEFLQWCLFPGEWTSFKSKEPNGWYWSKFLCNTFLGKPQAMKTKRISHIPHSASWRLGEVFEKKDRRMRIVGKVLIHFDIFGTKASWVESCSSPGWAKGMIMTLPFSEHLLCDRHSEKCFTNIPLFVTGNLHRWTLTTLCVRKLTYKELAQVHLEKAVELELKPTKEPWPTSSSHAHTLNWLEWSKIITWLREDKGCIYYLCIY